MLSASLVSTTKPWIRFQILSAFLFFLSAQFLGLLLRWQFVQGWPRLNYKFFLHAHSHVALLGWVHALLIIVLGRAFLTPVFASRWNRLFWMAQSLVLGMLISFPIQGYAAVSIALSTLFLFVSYAQARLLLQAIHGDFSLSCRLLRASLGWMVLSSLGPWSLGPIIAMKLQQTPLYYLAVYFYLHFQYNGWFFFGLLALLLRWLEQQKIIMAIQPPRQAMNLLLWSCLPAYALSTLWAQPPQWVWLVAAGAALSQCIALALLWHWGWKLQGLRGGLLPEVRFLLALAWGCVNLKFLLQALTAWPFFVQWASTQRALVIFYLHLVLLGYVSCTLLAYLLQEEALSCQAVLRWGLGSYVLGFGLSEALLLGSGLAVGWALPWPVWIFYASLLIFGGWLLITIGLARNLNPC